MCKNDNETGITMFSCRMLTRPVDPESRGFQIKSSPEMFVYIMPMHMSYSKINILIFPPSYTPKTYLFISTYPITENEFGHTASCKWKFTACWSRVRQTLQISGKTKAEDDIQSTLNRITTVAASQ